MTLVHGWTPNSIRAWCVLRNEGEEQSPCVPVLGTRSGGPSSITPQELRYWRVIYDEHHQKCKLRRGSAGWLPQERLSMSQWCSQGWEVTVHMMSSPGGFSVSSGPGEDSRRALGWTPLLRTPNSGLWVFRGVSRGEQLLAALVSSVDWVVRGIYRTAWAVTPHCRCSYACGRWVAVGPQTGERSWELL